MSVVEQLSSDLEVLNNLNGEQLLNLVNLSIDFLTDPSKSESFLTGLSSFAETNRVNMGGLKNTVKSMLVFLQGGMKDGLTAGQLEQRCQSYGLSSEAASVISNCWMGKLSFIASAIVSKTIASNRLVDMDWSFGVTASSDDMDQVGKTFLQLKLVLSTGEEGGAHKDVFLELSLEQFYQFLAQLEKCKSYLDFVSAQ